MAQEYTINFVSRVIYFLRGFFAIAIGLLITLIIATNLSEHLPILIFFLTDALITILLFFLTRNWHKGQLIIGFREKEIFIESHLPLLRHSRKWIFYWNELKNISFSDTQYFRVLIVKDLKKRVVFAMDYGEAVTNFEEKLNRQIAKHDQAKHININQKPSIYETRSSPIVAIILGLMMIAWPIAVWLNQREFKIGLAMVFYSGASFFIYMVFRTRRRKRL